MGGRGRSANDWLSRVVAVTVTAGRLCPSSGVQPCSFERTFHEPEVSSSADHRQQFIRRNSPLRSMSWRCMWARRVHRWQRGRWKPGRRRRWRGRPRTVRPRREQSVALGHRWFGATGSFPRRRVQQTSAGTLVRWGGACSLLPAHRSLFTATNTSPTNSLKYCPNPLGLGPNRTITMSRDGITIVR